MKSLIKGFNALLLLLITNVAIADTEKPLFHLEAKEEKVIYLETKSTLSSYVEISFQNEEGEIIFSEYSPSPDTFERYYNFEELASGNYYFIIASDSKVQKLLITVSDTGINVNLEELRTI